MIKKNTLLRKRGILHILIILMFACCMLAAGTAIVFAGGEADGGDTQPVELPTDPGNPGGFTYTEIMMDPGKTYNISDNKKATWMTATESGTYRIVGQSTNTLLLIHARADMEIKVIFGDDTRGVRLTATKDGPGTAAKARSAVTIEGAKGGKVILSTAAGQNCYFRAKGGVPAIRKDSTDVETIFTTEDPDNPGTFEVHADASAEKTSAIGCYSNFSNRHTFGNVTFKSGKIEAYGSQSGTLGGGPGIGADMYGRVNGITFEDADVKAVAGSGSSAAIGTASAYVFMPFAPAPASQGDMKAQDEDPGLGDSPDDPVGDRVMGIQCRNITIKGGKVQALHDKHVDENNQYGGAGIGGGWGCHSDSIRIEGGDVTAKGTGEAAGIGGGCEGNCNGYDDKYTPNGYDGDNHGITITGGNITATGGATGIGSGYAPEMTLEKDRLRFGDCRVHITGGNVTATGSSDYGIGIGGFKSKDYDPVMKVIISGGRVNATGKEVGIGAGYSGVMKEITIEGGRVKASSGTKDYPAIGSYGAENPRKSPSYCEKINITGGTVITGDTIKNNPGYIGGYKDSSGETPVYISGGNVYGKIYKTDAHRSSSDSTVVYPNIIKLTGYGLIGSLRSSDDVAIKDLGISGGNPDYGLKDAYLFPSDIDVDPVMDIWLPAGMSVDYTKTDPAFLGYGLQLQKKDVTEFRGLTEAGKGGELFPGFWFLFDNNYKAKDTTVCSAFANIGDAKATEATFKPETITVDGKTISPSAYTLDEERTVPLIRADGTFARNVNYKSCDWTDSEGRLLMTSSDPEKYDPRTGQNYYLDGIMLYGLWDDYILSFNGNKPAGASTEMTGDMSSDTGKYEEKVTIPECGYKLPGYSFRGWATAEMTVEADRIYKAGEEVKATDLDPARTGKITLYAQWEPMEYTIKFESGEAGLAPETQTAVFDEPGQLKTIEEMEWVYSNRAFHGWTDKKLGSLIDDGEDFCNLCTLNEAGEPTGSTLEAVWIADGTISVSVTRNGTVVNDLEKDLVITDGSSTFDLPVYENKGVYTFDPILGNLPPGEYHLIIKNDNYPVREDAGAFTYDGAKAVSLVLDYYTVTAKAGDEHFTGVYLKEGGTSAPLKEITVLDDTQLRLEAVTAPGYTLDVFRAAGVAPQWDPASAAQTIKVQGQTDITAYSKLAVYSISYNLDGGIIPSGESNPESYTIESPAFTLINPEKQGYIFTGWTGTDLEEPTANVIVENGSFGDRTYTATWKKQDNPKPGPDDDDNDNGNNDGDSDDDSDGDSDTGDTGAGSRLLLCGLGMLISLAGAIAAVRRRREN